MADRAYFLRFQSRTSFYDMTVMMLMKSSRACAAAAALVAILCFAAAPLARAQTEKQVPGELKVNPGNETQSPTETATPDNKEEKA